MVYDMVHDLWKNTVEGQDFFVVHACTKSLHKAHEICTKISNSSSPAYEKVLRDCVELEVS